MDEETIIFASKSYMRHLVAQTNEYPFLYKYCSFEGGYSMLSAMNIQFTRADELNDEDEINLSKTNIETHLELLREANIPESVISSKLEEAKSFFGGIGICSCGKTAHNKILWENYASSDGLENGICIEISQKMVIDYLLSKGIKVIALLVHYFDNVSNILPWNLFLGNTFERQIFLQLLYTSKLRSKWAEEDEVRLVYSEPFSGAHFRPLLNPKCITSVFYGRDMSKSQRIKIGQILNRYKYINRIMTH